MTLEQEVQRFEDRLTTRIELDPQAGAGFGLESTAARLRLHYGERAALRVLPGPAGGTAVELELPFRSPRCAP